MTRSAYNNWLNGLRVIIAAPLTRATWNCGTLRLRYDEFSFDIHRVICAFIA